MAEKKLYLQGLRAIAITAVLLFHFFPQWFPNGYLGVDQFFFLSGYLMAMMMHRYSKHTLCTIGDFLYRRVKRIVPLYYLVTVITIGFLRLAPSSALETNVNSALPALFFATNLIQEDNEKGYAEKLGIAVDMFTHTWSLSLEMQFYLLFPVIFILSHSKEKKPYLSVLNFCSIASFTFYCFTNSFLSFNCVLSRIWQFLPGMYIYDLSIKPKFFEDKESLIKGIVEKEDKEEVKNLKSFFANASLLLTLCLMFFPDLISPHYARITAIILTSVVVYVCEENLFLSNPVMVYIGEISYCWYLVHWPIVAHFKLIGWNTSLYMSFGILLSGLISIIIHHIYENRYIYWKKEKIVAVVVVLFWANMAVLMKTSENLPKPETTAPMQPKADNVIHEMNNSNFNTSYYFASDFLKNITMGYENKTKEERAALNNDYDANDGAQQRTHPCEKIATNEPKELRCKISSSNDSSKSVLLVIGNSYARNAMKVINEECEKSFKTIYMSQSTACEPLFETHTAAFNCEGYDVLFQEAVKKYKPDYLLMVTRHFASMRIRNGTNPFNDFNFATAVKRLQVFEQNVQKKIFLMEPFQEPKSSLITILNRYLKEGVAFTDDQVTDTSQLYMVAKERMGRLAKGCKKCELYDYAAQFFIDGKYRVYDPHYHVAFFTSGLHLTPAGLERVRPVFCDLCKNRL